MDIDKCRILLEAIDCGSLSAAAAKLGYTTAGVSYNVDSVENELGFPVIRRGHSGISLTSNGEKIIPILRELIRVNQTLENQAFELRKEINGEVKIGAFSGIAIRLLPKIIQRFQKEFPDVSIKIREGQQQQLDEMLEKDEVDFCICSFQKNNRYEWIPLMDDQMVCVLPSDHPLAGKKEIAPEELENQPLIMPAYGRDPDAMGILEKFGVEPDIKYTTVETNTAFAMAEHGFGIVVTNLHTTQDRVKEAVIRPFNPPQYITEGIYLDSMDTAPPLVRRMIRYLVDYFRDEKNVNKYNRTGK